MIDNRPVHLARRDAFFECAVEVLYAPRAMDDDISIRLMQVERVLSLIQRAEKHAFLTAHTKCATQRELDFLHFLGLISKNVQSAHSMLLNQMHLEESESFLRNFLATDNNDYALPAIDYGRRAEDIMKGLWHVLRLALAPYRTLQRENLSEMGDGDKVRYDKAYKSVKTELGAAMA